MFLNAIFIYFPLGWDILSSLIGAVATKLYNFSWIARRINFQTKMQASSCSITNFEMYSKRIHCNKANQLIGTSESYTGQYLQDSIKRKKIDRTDWDRTVKSRKLSDNCVFIRARESTVITELGGIDQISPRRACNHRYGPTLPLAGGAFRRKYLVSRRLTGRITGISSSGWTQHTDNW